MSLHDAQCITCRLFGPPHGQECFGEPSWEHDWEEQSDTDENGTLVFFVCRRCPATARAFYADGVGYQPGPLDDAEFWSCRPKLVEEA